MSEAFEAASRQVPQAGNTQQGGTEHIPASVRNAPDLSASLGSSVDGAPVQQANTPTWRVEANTPEEFQRYVQESSKGAVVFALYADHSPASVQMVQTTQRLVDSAAGAMLLAAVDITKLPEAAQTFGISGVPAGIAVLAGRPAPIYNGTVSEQELADVLSQLLQLAAQYQLPGGFEPTQTDDEKKPLPPLHAKALEALDAGDYDGARTAYQQAITENPGDKDAKLGLEQVELLARVKNLDPSAARAAAAANPLDIDAAFNVADLDVTGGHVEDAYARLLRLFKAVPAEEKTRVRERLVQLFDVVGATDPHTTAARAELTTALF